MKKNCFWNILILIMLALMPAMGVAQAPEKFTYQAVLRNASNQLITNGSVGVRVSVLQGTAMGTPVYVEIHTATTNANGLLTLEIGDGTVQQGSFFNIDWADGPFFLKTETDPNGGSNYSIKNVQQLLSMPYALYAKEAGNGFSGDYNDLINTPEIPTIPNNVSTFTNDAGYITMDSVPTNVSTFTNDAGYITMDSVLTIAVRPKMMFEKTSSQCRVFIRTDDPDKYICYPLVYTHSVSAEYPADIWGIGRVAVYRFDGVSMNFIDRLFQSGEAELAVNVGEGGYVGGSTHGFEYITSTDNMRNVRIFIDEIGIDEDSIVSLLPINKVYVMLSSELYENGTNTNPFASVKKEWLFSEKGLSITSTVTILRSIQINQCQMGMMCVYRHYNGNINNDYLTNKAVKDSEPFKVYSVIDGWETGNINNGLKHWDSECRKITEYGDCDYCFSLSISNIITPASSIRGMKVGTNNSAYNKIYFDITGPYLASQGDVLGATQTWYINKVKNPLSDSDF